MSTHDPVIWIIEQVLAGGPGFEPGASISYAFTRSISAHVSRLASGSSPVVSSSKIAILVFPTKPVRLTASVCDRPKGS
jgi:hypothetical protein